MERTLAGATTSSYWKWLIGSTAVLMGIYAVASTYLWARQAYYIFRPKRIISSTPDDYQLPFKDVYIKVNEGSSNTERVHAWWIPAEDPGDRCLLYLHGSALNIAANISHARRFQRLGFSVLLVSYRGYGKSDGTFPSEATVYSDARAAWRYLTEQKSIDPASIFIYGHSLGGAVAIELAMDQPAAAGLIIEATFTSIADMAREIPRYRIFPLELIVHQRFDSISKVGRLQVPVLYLHGTADRLVPPEMSRQLYQQTASSKRLKFIEGGGHNNSAAVGGEEYLQAVQKFLETRTAEPRPATSSPRPARGLSLSNGRPNGMSNIAHQRMASLRLQCCQSY
jgi:pimeloyl-ACP methyl ester carboxylesterase